MNWSVSFGALALIALAGCFLDPEVKSLRDDAGASTPATGTTGTADAGLVSFARDIRPLFAAADATPGGCRPCHYAGDTGAVGVMVSQFDMTTLGTLRKGGTTSGSNIIVPGRPDQSALVQKLEGTAVGARMPRGRALWSTADIAKVRQWIDEGAMGADSE
jgi:hypothetical protein